MKLILFRGRPGTGKTTLSSALSEQLNYPVIRKDDFYDCVSPLIPEHGLRNKIAYGTLYSILESNSKTDCTLILDYPFQTPADLAIIKKWCLAHHTTLISILVTCSDEKLWAERFNKRAINPTPNQLIVDFDELKKHYSFMQIEAEDGEITADSANPIAQNIHHIISYI